MTRIAAFLVLIILLAQRDGRDQPDEPAGRAALPRGAMAARLDRRGPLRRTVRDCAYGEPLLAALGRRAPMCSAGRSCSARLRPRYPAAGLLVDRRQAVLSDAVPAHGRNRATLPAPSWRRARPGVEHHEAASNRSLSVSGSRRTFASAEPSAGRAAKGLTAPSRCRIAAAVPHRRARLRPARACGKRANVPWTVGPGGRVKPR